MRKTHGNGNRVRANLWNPNPVSLPVVTATFRVVGPGMSPPPTLLVLGFKGFAKFCAGSAEDQAFEASRNLVSKNGHFSSTTGTVGR